MLNSNLDLALQHIQWLCKQLSFVGRNAKVFNEEVWKNEMLNSLLDLALQYISMVK